VDSALTPALGMAASTAEERISAENLSQIVQFHQRRIYRVIYLFVRDGDVADTLTQECFLRAFAKRASFRGECRLETWLLRIAVNLARDHARNRRASFWRKLIGLDGIASASDWQEPRDHNPSPERTLLAREQLDAVWSALSDLSPQQREIFLLRFGEEMSLAEVASLLGLQVGSVKAQLSRAIAKLRGMLKEHHGIPNQSK
jgi:RNA polymerase sigma-70 factor, ECF subfamily